MKNLRWIMILTLISTCENAFAQLPYNSDSNSSVVITMVAGKLRSHDTIFLYGFIVNSGIKSFRGSILNPVKIVQASPKKNSLIEIHGNFHYDYLYRSFSDTPYYQKNFQQHTVQSNLTITYRDKYPFVVNMIVRKSNSPFFRNYFDGGLTFDKISYDKVVKQDLLEKLSNQIPGREYLVAATSLLENEIKKYNILKSDLKSINLSQKIIEEREGIYYQGIQLKQFEAEKTLGVKTDSFSTDLPKGASNRINKFDFDTILTKAGHLDKTRFEELDSIQKSIQKLKKKVDSLNSKFTKDRSALTQKVIKARNSRELATIVKEYGLEQSKGKGEKFISDLRTIGIGRSILNYSELTTKNVSLTGVNIEYNPKLYIALAVGKIDYGFRDFVGNNTNRNNQHLVMTRFGFGDRDSRALIFSVFSGKKIYHQNAFRDSLSNKLNVVGYSVESIFRKNENTFLSVELAKTTFPITGSLRQNDGLRHLLKISEHSNLGISLNGEKLIDETDTKISGFYRRTGENFQSFSLFTYNTDQTAWLLKVEQPFIKRRLGVIAMLRRNDFINPFAQQTFKTSTVFKSFQINVRIPRLPVFSAGYFPGSQLYIIDKYRATENAYYILNGSLMHSYGSRDLRMYSSIMYNKYSSKGTDTGFIAYRGANYMASQAFNVGKFQIQGQYMFTDQEKMRFYTLDCNLDYSISSNFKISVGGKFNRIISGKDYVGGLVILNSTLKGIGTIQLHYEKSYLPTVQRTLFPVEIGRLSWFKSF